MSKNSDKLQKNLSVEWENATKEKSEKSPRLKTVFKNIKTRIWDAMYNCEPDGIITPYNKRNGSPKIYRKGGKYWMKCSMKNEDGKTVKMNIEPKYDGMYDVYLADYPHHDVFDWESDPDFQPDKWYAVVKSWNKKWLIDFYWNEVIELKYDDMSFTMGDKIMIKEWDKWWMMDREWKILIEPKYTGTYWISESFRAVKIWDQVWLINKEWKEIVEPKYDNIYKLDSIELEPVSLAKHTRFVVEKWNKQWLINKEWKEIVEPKYDEIVLTYTKGRDSWNGVVVVKLWDKYWLLSTVDGSTIFDTIYDNWHQNFPNLFSSDPEKNERLIFKNKDTWEKKIYWRYGRKK